ncbi:MAG: hypothetical protein JXA99_11760 [Candidatus Lokiarchaeota archaeon]|nr:hypothetical protein [Candidatus Lokiarchaeota archaeon]
MVEKIVSLVKSPAKTHHLRKGNGFSKAEIKKAGKSIQLLKELNVKIDYNRKSAYEANINLLKGLKSEKKSNQKREPFVKKEKKKTPFQPKDSKSKRKTVKKTPVKKQVSKPIPKKIIIKEKKPVQKKILQKIPKPEISGIPLTNLSGLGPKTSEKFNEVGVNSVEDLLKENPEELATLVKGCSIESINKWVEEAKELVK